MIEATLTSIAQNLDRIADAMERIATQQGEAVMLARLETVERKTAALADLPPAPAPAPEPQPEPTPVAATPAPEATEPAPGPVAAAPAKAVTHDDVRAAAKELVMNKRTKEWKAILAERGAATVSDLDAGALPDVLKAIQTLLATKPQTP